MKAKTAVRLSAILILCLLGNRYYFAKDNNKSKNSKSNIVNKNIIGEYVFNHVKSKDIGLIDSAFADGYTDNIVNVNVDGKSLQTLTIQSTDGNKFIGAGRTAYSVWTRDLYWGFLGWSQAGDDHVLKMMKSSLRLLIMAKNKNQALGQSKMWPLNDKRFYIPQAYSTDLKIAIDLYPWCSESQADFLLLAYNYWRLSGDRKFIKSIWNDIEYVTGTLELLDTNGDSLPDALQGSYDYQWVVDSEDPLMCAKTSMAYSDVAKLAHMLGKDRYADSLEMLAAKIKKTMNKSVEEGGLWKNDSSGGYYVDMRRFSEISSEYLSLCADKGYYVDMTKSSDGKGEIDDKFIPYENLVPMWFGMTNSKQDKAIFAKLDAGFKKYYDLPYGPEYCAPAGHNDQSVMNCSSVTWLGFLDVYLRGKKGHDTNRSRIFDMLMKHAHDAGGIPFPEGAGVLGYLTGGAGRTWDNGNFFQMLICGIYGLEKSKDGITISAPEKIDGTPLTELKNFRWRKALYDFKWTGKGKNIKSVTIDGNEISSDRGIYILTDEMGIHKIKIELYK
jgi:hypothetical protein